MHPIAIDAATVEKLISAASAAPSFHNTQPWRFRWDADRQTFDVRADTERGLRYEDPEGRALHISVGAAVLNMRAAAAGNALGCEVRLLPDRSDRDLLARVHVGNAPSKTDPAIGDLSEAIWLRHSSRHPFSARRPPEGMLSGMVEAARSEGARLHLPDRDEVERLRRLTAEAEWYNRSDTLRRRESRQWIHDEGDDGLQPAALGPHDAAGRLPLRDFSSLQPDYAQPSEVFEADPRLAVLTTDHDEREDWLRAGQALERVLLKATSDGLVASLLHQALEWPHLRWQLRDPSAGMYYVQMIIRFGYGPEGSPSRRRPINEVLEERPPDEPPR